MYYNILLGILLRIFFDGESFNPSKILNVDASDTFFSHVSYNTHLELV